MPDTLLLKPDPPMRLDGLCVVCGGERTIPTKGTNLKNSRESALLDPFCSVQCCRAFHGLPTAPTWSLSSTGVERSKSVCGTAAAYRRGCRCELCCEAKRASKGRK